MNAVVEPDCIHRVYRFTTKNVGVTNILYFDLLTQKYTNMHVDMTFFSVKMVDAGNLYSVLDSLGHDEKTKKSIRKLYKLRLPRQMVLLLSQRNGRNYYFLVDESELKLFFVVSDQE